MISQFSSNIVSTQNNNLLPQTESQKLMLKQLKEIEVLTRLQKQELEQQNNQLTIANCHQWNQLIDNHEEQLKYPHIQSQIIFHHFTQCQKLLSDQQEVQKTHGNQLWQKHVQEGEQLKQVHLAEAQKLISKPQENKQQVVQELMIKKPKKQLKALQKENVRPLNVFNKLPDNENIRRKPQTLLLKLSSKEKFASLKKAFPSVVALNNCLDDKIVNFTDENGNTLLHLAVMNISKDFHKIDIHKLGDIDRVNHEGNTALHIACEIRDWKVVKFLLESGADDHIKNNKEFTPFNLMGRNVPIDVLQMFGKANAYREKRQADTDLDTQVKRTKF